MNLLLKWERLHTHSTPPLYKMKFTPRDSEEMAITFMVEMNTSKLSAPLRRIDHRFSFLLSEASKKQIKD